MCALRQSEREHSKATLCAPIQRVSSLERSQAYSRAQEIEREKKSNREKQQARQKSRSRLRKKLEQDLADSTPFFSEPEYLPLEQVANYVVNILIKRFPCMDHKALHEVSLVFLSCD